MIITPETVEGNEKGLREIAHALGEAGFSDGYHDTTTLYATRPARATLEIWQEPPMVALTIRGESGSFLRQVGCTTAEGVLVRHNGDRVETESGIRQLARAGRVLIDFVDQAVQQSGAPASKF